MLEGVLIFCAFIFGPQFDFSKCLKHQSIRFSSRQFTQKHLSTRALGDECCVGPLFTRDSNRQPLISSAFLRQSWIFEDRCSPPAQTLHIHLEARFQVLVPTRRLALSCKHCLIGFTSRRHLMGLIYWAKGHWPSPPHSPSPWPPSRVGARACVGFLSSERRGSPPLPLTLNRTPGGSSWESAVMSLSDCQKR